MSNFIRYEDLHAHVWERLVRYGYAPRNDEVSDCITAVMSFLEERGVIQTTREDDANASGPSESD